MWPATKITELLKIRLPLIQAPIASGIITPELIAAVSNAGVRFIRRWLYASRGNQKDNPANFTAYP